MIYADANVVNAENAKRQINASGARGRLGWDCPPLWYTNNEK
jgi:hypothetical protein